MRMFIICLLIIGAIVIYDQVRISSMRKELNQVTYQLHLEKSKKTNKAASTPSKQVNEIKSHLERAKRLIKLKRSAEAQKEIQIAIDKMNSVEFKAQEYLDSADKYWKKTKSGAIEALKGAIKDIATESPKEKPSEPEKVKK